MIFKKGFSLIESVIAMAVLSIAGLGVLKLYGYLETEKANSALWVQATILAKSTISQLQQVNTNYVCANGDTISFNKIDSCPIRLDEDSPFTLSIKAIKTLNALSKSGNDIDFAKIIHVSVFWNDRKGLPQVLTLPTSVSIFTNLL